MAGCALGVRLFLPEAQLIGISVARKSKPLREFAARDATAAARLIDVDETFTPEDIVVNDEYYGTFYGVPSEAGNKAILTAAPNRGADSRSRYTPEKRCRVS